MSKQNYSVARVKTRTQESVGKFERHIERKNEHYTYYLLLLTYYFPKLQGLFEVRVKR